jgi:hypothetical protein
VTYGFPFPCVKRAYVANMAEMQWHQAKICENLAALCLAIFLMRAGFNYLHLRKRRTINAGDAQQAVVK